MLTTTYVLNEKRSSQGQTVLQVGPEVLVVEVCDLQVVVLVLAADPVLALALQRITYIRLEKNKKGKE